MNIFYFYFFHRIVLFTIRENENTLFKIINFNGKGLQIYSNNITQRILHLSCNSCNFDLIMTWNSSAPHIKTYENEFQFCVFV